MIAEISLKMHFFQIMKSYLEKFKDCLRPNFIYYKI